MQKFYLLSIIFFSYLSAASQQPPITLKCVSDKVLYADNFNCYRIVNNIDPILPAGVSPNRVTYLLEGATSRKGTGSASGLRFNTGVTKVTYTFPLNPVLECSFLVTVINRNLIFPDPTDLPTVRGTCSVQVVKRPAARDSCSGVPFTAVTNDPLTYSKPGMYPILWRYILYGELLFTKIQFVIVDQSFVPDIDTLPDIVGKCFAEVTSTPTGVNKCTNRRIKAITRDPLIYNQRGTYTIDWEYVENGDTIYRQSQKVIVRERARIIPDIDSLPAINANCSITITKFPTAKNSCTDSVLQAVPLTPVKYDQPGTYTLRWRYIDKGDTLIQVQRLTVRGAIIVPDIDTLKPIQANCSIVITKYPQAKNSCTDSFLIAVPLSPVKYDQPGSYLIRWRYIDRRDTLIQTQEVIVAPGRIVPDIDTLPVIHANCSIGITKYPQAKNSCTDSVLIAVPLSPVKYDQPGSYLIRWRYIDKRDTLIQTQQVIVAPGRIVPDIDTLPVVTGGCIVRVTKFPTAKNPCNGAAITATTHDPVAFDQPGNYYIRWRYVDKYDSLVQVQQVLVTAGKIVPDSMNLPILRGCSVKITSVPTASNSCTNKTIKAKTSDPLIYDVPGKYTIRWIYADSRDTIEQVQRVEVSAGLLIPDEDTLQTLIGKCSVAVDKNPTSRNSCNGKLITGTTNDPLLYDTPGNYKITWVFDDHAVGTSVTQSQIVIVEDAGQVIPDITILPDLIADCSITVTTFPTATNSCNGASVSASTTDPVIYNQPGRYTIRWIYTSRNQASVVQNQTVVITGNSVLVPEISSLPDLQGICSVVASDVPLAKNKCSGNVIRAVTNDPLVYSGAGSYKIRWIYIDGRDTLTQEQSVTIISNGRLVADKVFLSPIVGDCEVRVDKIPTATNSCSRKVFTATTSDPLLYSIPGTYTIRWTIQEGTNVIQQTQLVTVNAVQETIRIGPNPTTDEFRIIRGGCGLSQKIVLRVYDFVGRVIEAKEYRVNDDIRFGATYPRGAYVVQVLWGEKRFVYKLIKK